MPRKSLSIFIFPKLFDVQYLARFEKETGIKLRVSYYENNDELLIKMRKTKGQGFDIIIPSDYAVDILRKEGLLKKLDKSRLDFLGRINKNFMGKYFDPSNNYSIPYSWETYKIGYNKNMFKKPPLDSWKLVFSQNYHPKCVIMNNNPREAVLLAAFYLFGSIDNLDDEKLEKIKNLLIKQKKWVEVYTDIRSDYMLETEACPVAVGSSGEIWKATRFNKDLGFLVPKEGTFMLIDSVAVSAKSKNDDFIYKFLNFLYSKGVMNYHVQKYSLLPVMKDTQLYGYLRKSLEKIEKALKEAKKIDFFRNVLSEKQLNKIWIDLKVK
ncbi:PotD/PotF family extracellular solute-binding protein [Candidatus Dependentiae bacterium]